MRMPPAATADWAGSAERRCWAAASMPRPSGGPTRPRTVRASAGRHRTRPTTRADAASRRRRGSAQIADREGVAHRCPRPASRIGSRVVRMRSQERPRRALSGLRADSATRRARPMTDPRYAGSIALSGMGHFDARRQRYSRCARTPRLTPNPCEPCQIQAEPVVARSSRPRAVPLRFDELDADAKCPPPPWRRSAGPGAGRAAWRAPGNRVSLM